MRNITTYVNSDEHDDLLSRYQKLQYDFADLSSRYIDLSSDYDDLNDRCETYRGYSMKLRNDMYLQKIMIGFGIDLPDDNRDGFVSVTPNDLASQEFDTIPFSTTVMTAGSDQLRQTDDSVTFATGGTFTDISGNSLSSRFLEMKSSLDLNVDESYLSSILNKAVYIRANTGVNYSTTAGISVDIGGFEPESQYVLYVSTGLMANPITTITSHGQYFSMMSNGYTSCDSGNIQYTLYDGTAMNNLTCANTGYLGKKYVLTSKSGKVILRLKYITPSSDGHFRFFVGNSLSFIGIRKIEDRTGFATMLDTGLQDIESLTVDENLALSDVAQAYNSLVARMRSMK